MRRTRTRPLARHAVSTRAALIFGIAAATIEMGIVLWMMYC